MPYAVALLMQGRAVTVRARIIRRGVAAIRRNEVEPPQREYLPWSGPDLRVPRNRLASGLGRGPVDDLALDWQLHENLKSAADATMQRHRPVMRCCDCIHDRKSESGPLGVADP
jgi:hypothetical protein